MLTLAAVLLLGCIRLAGLLHHEIVARATADALRSELPPDSSLWAIGGGKKGGAVLRFGGGPDSESRLVLFVLHAQQEPADIRFWGQTARLVVNAPTGSRIRFWGICDSGPACGLDRPKDRFAVLGYLDPYEMRMMALADNRKEALLYRGPKLPGLRVPILQTARAEALAILREAR